MTYDDVLQGIGLPNVQVLGRSRRKLISVFRGESGKITALKTGADRSAPELKRFIISENFPKRWPGCNIFCFIGPDSLCVLLLGALLVGASAGVPTSFLHFECLVS
ncbi:MAG: hypothetical protein GXP08_15665 [Gammaproteobacteria bacterium]|nr:hypothetical protein [Gammaproteobacteria bacterium]